MARIEGVEPQLQAATIAVCVLPADRKVTDGARTRDLRSHNPSEHFRVRADRFHYVAYLSQKITVRRTSGPLASGCVLPSIAAALLPLMLQTQTARLRIAIAATRAAPFVTAECLRV